MRTFKKPIIWTLLVSIIFTWMFIQLLLDAHYILAIISIIIFSIFIKHMIILGVRTYRGDFMYKIDLSHVEKNWFKIPNTRAPGNGKFLHSVLYKKKGEEETKKPYMILAHGMGGCLEDLELMAVPLALIGYNVISFNQSGHGLMGHHSPGNGKDYSKIMVNIHDVVDHVMNQDDLAKDENDVPRIGFLGASTGGLMALTQAYLNKNIKVTIALSGIHDFRELLAKQDDYPKFSKHRLFLFMLRRMKVKLDYTEEENKVISPKHCLKPLEENKKRVFMLHCKNDPLPFKEALKNMKAAGIPPENTLFLERGGHAFRSQETVVGSVIQDWLRKFL